MRAFARLGIVGIVARSVIARHTKDDEILTYSSFCRLKSSLHSIFTHVSRIQYTFSTKLMV
ncbi:hypothetical protein HMPREF0971_00381 [Segatella oris F0302]|uniref:Uncharacterized protein n=1 Tax=Segatella oris F0302 TaxID=649760 RepID=D1QN45_9BACT|nr:hypothetical protein HMPREF0971_00381 [Segatella oris F0302]